MATTAGSELALAGSLPAAPVWHARTLPCGLLLLLILSIATVYASSFASMIDVWWSSSSFIHCFLILPTSLFLIWQRRRTIRELRIAPSLVGTVAIVAAVVIWTASSLAQVQFGQQLSVMAMVVAAVWAVMGTPIAKALRFPLLFAFFAVPFGEFLIWPLMELTARFTVAAIQLIGIPVYLEGNRFTLPSGSYEVVEACSGLRYLIVTTVVGVLFAHMSFRDWRLGIFVVAAMAAVMVIANWVRALVIVLVAHYSGMKYGTGSEHIVLGLVIFVVFLLLALWIGSRFADVAEHSSEKSLPGKRLPGFKSHLPGLVIVFIIVELSILGGPIALESRLALAGDSSNVPQLPEPVDRWGGPREKTLNYEPSFQHATSRLAGSYRTASTTVELHVEYYRQQRQGSELIGGGNRLFNEGWQLVGRPLVEPVKLAELGVIVPEAMLLSNGNQRLLLWFWYDIGGYSTTNPLFAKLWRTWNLLRGSDSGDALVALAAEVDSEDFATADKAMRLFLLQHGARLQDCLRPEPPGKASCVRPTSLQTSDVT